MSETSGMLATREVARRLGLDPRTVRRLVDADELPAQRVGRRRHARGRAGVLRFRLEDVEAYLQARK